MAGAFMRAKSLAGLLLAAAVALAVSCSGSEPVRIGYIGGLTGRVADLGQAGLKGASMAVDDWNARGGVNGRKVEFLVGDDRQEPEGAREAFESLAQKKVECFVGHMTSAMSLVGAKLASDARIPMISPTTTTTDLSSKDDYFFRVISSTLGYGSAMASHLWKARGVRRVVLVTDLNNKSYTATWAGHFENAFKGMGGKVIARKDFTSGPNVSFALMAKEIAELKPDAAVLAASAMDAAMFSQQLRKLDADISIAAAEWASTEKLIELGGVAVEGMSLNQYFDRDDRSPKYVAFRNGYRQRYSEEPGFAAVCAYDAVNVALTALAGKRPNESLKEALLRIREFEGLQNSFRFDDYGDTVRKSVIVTVSGGVFRVVQ